MSLIVFTVYILPYIFNPRFQLLGMLSTIVCIPAERSSYHGYAYTFNIWRCWRGVALMTSLIMSWRDIMCWQINLFWWVLFCCAPIGTGLWHGHWLKVKCIEPLRWRWRSVGSVEPKGCYHGYTSKFVLTRHSGHQCAYRCHCTERC